MCPVSDSCYIPVVNTRYFFTDSPVAVGCQQGVDSFTLSTKVVLNGEATEPVAIEIKCVEDLELTPLGID